MRKRFRWDRLLACLGLLAGLILGVWITAPYVDIVEQPDPYEPQYQSWNLFVNQEEVRN